MSCFLLAVRRLSRSLPFILCLLLLFASVAASPLLDASVRELPSGFYCPAECGEITGIMTSHLFDYGFMKCETEEALRHSVRDGVLNCGVIFPPDMDRRIKEAELDNSVIFLSSPASLFPVAAQNCVLAEIFVSVAPYISCDVLSDVITDFNADAEVLRVYRDATETEELFRFDVETVSGKSQAEVRPGFSLALLFSGILIFGITALQSCRLLSKEYSGIRRRVGARSAFLTVFLPEAFCTAILEFLCLCCAAVLATLLGGSPAYLGLIWGGASYIILTLALGFLLPIFIRRQDSIQMLMIPVLMLTIVLCPVFFDITLLYPAFRFLRAPLPTYWLWLCTENPVLTACVAPVLCLVSSFLLTRREATLLKRKD